MQCDDFPGPMRTELLLGNIGAAQSIDDPCAHIIVHGILNASGHLCQLLQGMEFSGVATSEDLSP